MRWLIFPQLRKWSFLNFTSLTIFSVTIFSVMMICSLWTDHAYAFTFQTTILNQKNGSPFLGRFDFHFIVYNKAKDCLLLYEKQSNVDLTATNGVAKLSVFDKVAYASVTPPRLIPPDPNISLGTVFGSILPTGGAALTVRTPSAPDCTSGYYMKVSNESRLMNVKIIPLKTGISTTMVVDKKAVTVSNGVATVSSTSVKSSDLLVDAITISPCANPGTISKGVLIGCSSINQIPTSYTISDGCN